MSLSFAETTEFIRKITEATGVEPAMLSPERITNIAMAAGISGGVTRELVAHVLWQHLNHSLAMDLVNNANADTEGPIFEGDAVPNGGADEDQKHVRLVRE